MFSENYEDILRAAAKQICDYVKYRYAHPQTGVSITGSLYSMARVCLDDIFQFLNSSILPKSSIVLKKWLKFLMCLNVADPLRFTSHTAASKRECPLHLASSTPLCPELFYSTAACYPREWLSIMSPPAIQSSLISIPVTASFSPSLWSPLLVLLTNGS